MTEAFDILPGIALPVREVTNQLALMWEVDDPDFSPTAHASQMNVVLHFGLNVGPEHARDRFDGLIRFAQRYPCRIIALCPSSQGSGKAMESKLFSQCYIGKSHREMCCCDALILRYNHSKEESLFNQLSIWLEGDLPTYYWFSNMPKAKMGSYLKTMRKLNVRCFVFDCSDEWIDPAALESFGKNQPRDLARAFLLPVRQAMGQFLSRYSVSAICSGLKAVKVQHASASGEGYALVEWVKSCFADCYNQLKSGNLMPEFRVENVALQTDCSLKIEFIYDRSCTKYFAFSQSGDHMRSHVRANFGEGHESVCVPIKPLELEQALGEAFFF